jgi:hypothetical protein
MRGLLERWKAERQSHIRELRESLGLDRVEGVGRREPALANAANGGGDLLALMGIDPDDLERAR